MLDIKARSWVGRAVLPLVVRLDRLGVRPAMLTIGGLVVMIIGSALIAAGHPITGAAVAGAGAILDVLDGPLARATDRASPRGAFLDTLTDRLGDLAVWAAVVYLVVPDRREIVLAVVGLAGSSLIPFVRAKAEAARIEGRGGLMGRAERLILLLAGVWLSGFGLATLEPTLWVMAVLTWLTVAQRAYRTWGQLRG